MIKLRDFHDWIFYISLFFIIMIMLFLMGFSFGAGFEMVKGLIK
jgi:hypothetical protein